MDFRPHVCSFALVFIILTQGLSADTIKMGYFELPPHQYKGAGGEVRGSSITYFTALAAKMGHEVKWVGPLPLPRLTEKLKEGNEIDGTIAFPDFPVFKKFLYYSKIPVFRSQPIFVVRKENPLNHIRSIKDIEGYRIGLVKSVSGRYLPLLDKNRNKVRLEPLGGEKWIEQNLKKLVSGRLEALFDRQQYTLPFVAAQLKLDNRIKVVPVYTAPTPFYITFSKASPKGKKLIRQLNEKIRQMDMDYGSLAQKELDALADDPYH